MRRYLTTLAMSTSLLLFPSAGFADVVTPDDQQLYASTVTAMRALPEPPYLTFITNVTTKGLNSLVLHDDAGIGSLRVFGPGNAQPSGSWTTSYRSSEDTASIATAPQRHLVSRSPLFIPTWTGVYDWFRFGFDGRPFLPNSVPQPSTTLDPNLKIIGIVKAMSPASYHITAANPALCPSGDQGRHLHLEPRGEVRTHPLTDVTIDVASARFCSIRFWIPVRGGRGYSELHFTTVNGYWMTTRDDAEIRLGLGLGRAEVHVTYDEIAFPRHARGRALRDQVGLKISGRPRSGARSTSNVSEQGYPRAKLRQA